MNAGLLTVDFPIESFNGKFFEEIFMSDMSQVGDSQGRGGRPHRSSSPGRGSEKPGRGNQRRSGYRDRRRPQRPVLSNLSFEDLQRYFLACGRCSYFLAGYRVLHGQPALGTAAAGAEDSWITLTWDGPTRELVFKSYGLRTDIDHFFIEHACPECQRRLVYDQGEEDTPADTFRMRIL